MVVIVVADVVVVVVVVISWFVVTEAVMLSDKQRRSLTGGGRGVGCWLGCLAALRLVEVGQRGTSTQVERRSLQWKI